MRILLDTNIVVDVLSGREGYEESLEVLRFCEAGLAEGLVSTATVMDVMYILRKYLPMDRLREVVQTFLSAAAMVEVKPQDITGALESGMNDFEDAVQALCGLRNGAEAIVTRNIKDFRQSPLKAVLPGEAIERMKS